MSEDGAVIEIRKHGGQQLVQGEGSAGSTGTLSQNVGFL
jgi:hypothetical protein